MIDVTGIFLLNVIWQSCALLIVALAVDYFLRRSPGSHRHFAWAGVLLLSLAIPIASFYVSQNSNFDLGFKLAGVNELSRIDTNPTAGTESSLPFRQGESNLLPVDFSKVFLLLTVFYLGYIVYRAIKLWLLWRRTGRILASSTTQKLPLLIETIMERCCLALQMKPVPILFSQESKTPLTVGVRNAVIVLPFEFLTTTSENILTAALGHELAHIRRRDYALNIFFEFVSLPVSFHPAIRMVKRKINQTREMACDELVSAHLLKPLVYARSLVQIAGNNAPPAKHDAYSLGVLNADALEKRIMKLVETNRGSGTRSSGRMRFLFALVLLGVSATTMSALSFALPLGENAVRENVGVTTRYNVEIYTDGKLFASQSVSGDPTGKSDSIYWIFRVKDQNARTPDGQKVFSFQVFPSLDGNGSIKVDVTAFLDDPSKVTEEPKMNALRKQVVGTYYPRLDEKTPLTGTSLFGESVLLEIRVSAIRDDESSSQKVVQPVDPQNGQLVILTRPLPRYTDAARFNNTSGRVKLSVTFLASGEIGEITRLIELPDGLTEKAVEAARGIKFKPAMQNGLPISETKQVEYFFSSQ